MTYKIRAMFVFEILGRPPEHVKETISQLVDKLTELPGIEISKKTVHEPKAVEDKNANLFTTFAEVEILGKDLNSLINIIFYAMPSHIEIIEPEEIRFKNFEMSNLLSDLTVKMHRYDEIAKALTIERSMLIGKLKELGVKFEVPKKEPAEQNKKTEKKTKKPAKKNNSKKKN
ncbi:MAG: hypothetical protein PHH54_02980 [Candidatus Nanoarchaeia archaeon]|nr:hypothetical protein [Candidatus Nanoarchaeia archaeon]